MKKVVVSLLALTTVAPLYVRAADSASNAKEAANAQLLNASSPPVKALSESLADLPVPAGLVQLPVASQYYSPYAFVVDKQARVLSVWQQTGTGLKEVAHYAADLGKNSGDKRGRGDAKTPEGIYFLTTRLDGAQIDEKIYGKRAFTTDYPNFFDSMEGKTGSGIWLHAVPDTVALTRGSKGCVVVRNDSIVDLSRFVTLKRTPLLIQNQTERLNSDELGKVTSELNDWIESWRDSWEKKDMATYITHYSDEFRSQKMDKDQWRKFKTKLGEQYKQITVRLSKPAIFADRNRVVMRFLQEYTSDQHADFGEKVLYMKRSTKATGPKFQIVGEQWSEETSQVARDEIEATTKAQIHPPAKNQLSGQPSGLGASNVRFPKGDLTASRK